MKGLASIIFLIHLVIAQGDNSDKTRKLDQMSIKIESSRNITMQTRQPIDPQMRFQIDNMSIEIESSRNVTNVSAMPIDPKVRLQMATSVCVSKLTLIKCRLKLKAQEILQTCQLCRPLVNINSV